MGRLINLGIVVLGGLVAFYIQSFFVSHPCIVDEESIWSCSYRESVIKFRQSVSRNEIKEKIELSSLQLMEVEDPTTGEKEILTIDIAYFGAKEPSKLLFHISGIHGVEAYAGSGIQIDWLRNLKAKEIDEFQDQGIGVIVVHTLNPYGMYQSRRWNENGVDLNRNLLTESEWTEVLETGGPAWKSYKQFDQSVFNPQQAPTWIDDYFTLTKALYYIAVYGFDNLKEAVVTGQYANTKGIFHGGQEYQPSYNLVLEYVKNHKNRFAKVQHSMVVDIHTGLGKSGKDTIMVQDESDCLPFRGDDGDAPVACAAMSDSNNPVTAGYSLTRGSTNEILKFLQIPGSHKTLTQEFGTVPGVLVLRALVLENMAFHYGTQEQLLKYSQVVRDVFYVCTKEWKDQLQQRGQKIISQTITALNKL